MKKTVIFSIIAFGLVSAFVKAQEAENKSETNVPKPIETASPKEPELKERGPLITLEQACRMAKKNNPSYHNIDEQIVQADAMIQDSWSMLLPRLSTQASIIRNENEVNMEFPTFDPDTGAMLGMTDMVIQEKWQKNLNLTASMTLFNARSIPLVKIAYDMAAQAELRARIARNDLLFAVASSYYQIITLRELIGVYSENLDVAHEFLRKAEARKKVGQTTKIDVMRAKIEVKDTRRRLDDAMDAHLSAQKALGFMVGIKGPYRTARPEGLKPINQTSSELTETALEQRVEIENAQKEIAIAERLKKETISRWIPKFDVTWQMDISSAEGFSGDKTNWMLIFGANWRILEGGGRIAQLKERESKIRVARNSLKQLRLDIKTDVDQKYRDTVSKKRHMDVSAEIMELAEENHKMIAKQYDVGMATSLDLLNASREMANKRIEHVIDELKWELSCLTLAKAIGEYNSLALE